MNKRGSMLNVIGIVIISTLFLLSLASLYFYYFHTFRLFRACVSSDIEQDTNQPCISDEECRELFLNNTITNLEETPEIIKNELLNVIDEAVYCDSTCRVKEIYGDSVGKPVESCEEGDKEFVLQMKGKELLPMLGYLKDRIQPLL